VMDNSGREAFFFTAPGWALEGAGPEDCLRAEFRSLNPSKLDL